MNTSPPKSPRLGTFTAKSPICGPHKPEAAPTGGKCGGRGEGRGNSGNSSSSQEGVLVPLVGNLYLTYGTRLDTETEQASAVVAHGLLAHQRCGHRSTVHTHHRLLLEVCGATRREAEEGEQAAPVCGVFDGKEHQHTRQQGRRMPFIKETGKSFCRHQWQEGR